MKSTLCLLGLATLALTSCVQNEVLEMPEGKPIEFSSFVEKGTRAVTPINSRASLRNFWVFGKNGDANFALDETAGIPIIWNDNKSQYTSETHAMWEVGKTYYFAAYSDGNSQNTNVAYTAGAESNQLTVSNYSVEDGKDLIASIYPPKTISQSSDIPSGRVVMPFQHMLTRVSFEFENSLPTTSTIGLRVKSLTFTGVKEGAECVYALAAGTYTCTWNGGTDAEYVYAKADDTKDILGPAQSHTFDKFVIPQSNIITATLVVETYHQKADKSGWEDTVADVQTYTLNLSYDHPNKTAKYWHPGYIYNYLVKASSDVAYIHFDASVADWERDLDANGDNGTNDDIDINVN